MYYLNLISPQQFIDGTIMILFIEEETEAWEAYTAWKSNIWNQAVWLKLILLTNQ